MNPLSFDSFNRNIPVADPAASPFSAQLAEQRQLIKAVKTLNKAEHFGENSELTFQVDHDSRRPVIVILDKQTKEVISQIPPEYVLEVAQGLKQKA